MTSGDVINPQDTRLFSLSSSNNDHYALGQFQRSCLISQFNLIFKFYVYIDIICFKLL